MRTHHEDAEKRLIRITILYSSLCIISLALLVYSCYTQKLIEIAIPAVGLLITVAFIDILYRTLRILHEEREEFEKEREEIFSLLDTEPLRRGMLPYHRAYKLLAKVRDCGILEDIHTGKRTYARLEFAVSSDSRYFLATRAAYEKIIECDELPEDRTYEYRKEISGKDAHVFVEKVSLNQEAYFLVRDCKKPIPKKFTMEKGQFVPTVN